MLSSVWLIKTSSNVCYWTFEYAYYMYILANCAFRVYTPFHDEDATVGTKIWQSLANALILLGAVVVMTVLLIVLYKYRCYKVWLVIYHIRPYTSVCSNRRASPSSKTHITSNSQQMPDKTSKDRPKTLKFEQYSGLFGCRTWANHHFLVNKGPCGSCLPYICVLYQTTSFIVELNRRAPKPLHSRTALLLGQYTGIRYI